ncbi:MAG: prepilin-type N-terminal cleavage/methylation domain-containing protein [Lachnospiraceae bacterium]|nr:prepilin-type N-terminal cleavage/methylation domain-containing protein [Lachnospiraceae bacterium]
MEKNNKGFSLVELIVVIAIMALLVAIIAPQLLKYIEKSKVSSDLQTMDAIYQALIYAANDPEVVQDAASMAEIDSMINPQTLEGLLGSTNTKFGKEFRDALNWGTGFNRSTYETLFESAHDRGSLEIYIQYKGGFMNPIAMWATYTDITGKKHYTSNNGNNWNNIGDCISIQ